MAGNDIVLEVPQLDRDVAQALVGLVAVSPGQDGGKILVVVVEELCSEGKILLSSFKHLMDRVVRKHFSDIALQSTFQIAPYKLFTTEKVYNTAL